MRVMVAGATGQAGHELQRTAPPDWVLSCFDSGQLDISDGARVQAAVADVRPDLIINAAAYTAVDRAQSEEALAYAVNRDGAAHLAEAAVAQGARLIHLSTDFVFDGAKSSPYLPADTPAPLGVYGASKLAGERAVLAAAGDGQALILRTSWLYSSHGANFVKTMLRLMRERESLGVVADQIGTPTWARGLAQAIWKAAAAPQLAGIFHWSDAGVASWYDFAVAIQEEALAIGLLGRPAGIRPLRTEEYPTPAKRPAFSVLDKSATWSALRIEGVHWRSNLRTMLKEVEP